MFKLCVRLDTVTYVYPVLGILDHIWVYFICHVVIYSFTNNATYCYFCLKLREWSYIYIYTIISSISFFVVNKVQSFVVHDILISWNINIVLEISQIFPENWTKLLAHVTNIIYQKPSTQQIWQKNHYWKINSQNFCCTYKQIEML